MKNLLKTILLLSICFNIAISNNLEDKAFNAYKNSNYQKAIELYKEAAKSNSLKAILMLGLFSEKGIGMPKNELRAIKFYKYILKKSKNLKSIIEKRDTKRLKVAIEALKSLYRLTDNEKYYTLSQKLQSLISKDYKTRQKPIAMNLFNQNSGNSIDDFLILCPNANAIAPENREGLEEFDCSLFENFPKRMALFMKLRRVKFEVINTPKRDINFLTKVNVKLAQIVKPIIRYLENEAIKCYKNAQTNIDIKECDYDYLQKSDPLLFDNASNRMEKIINRNPRNSYPLGAFEKNNLINKLIEKISNREYGKPWRRSNN